MFHLLAGDLRPLQRRRTPGRISAWRSRIAGQLSGSGRRFAPAWRSSVNINARAPIELGRRPTTGKSSDMWSTSTHCSSSTPSSFSPRPTRKRGGDRSA